jgi:MFS family permease
VTAAVLPRQVRVARWSVAAIFAVHGGVYGTFATRVPWIAGHVHASPGQLGLALIAPAAGAVFTMPLGARAIHRYGGRAVMRVLIVGWTLALILPAIAPNVPLLFLALLVYGSLAGLADVSMNAQGVAVERAYGRSIMSGLHGMWSIGTLVLSAIGAAVARSNVDGRVHFTIAAVALAVVGVGACAGLPPDRLPGEEAPAFAWPSRSIVLIGLVALCAVIAEGGSGDWAAVYLQSRTGADEGTAAAGFTAVALAMTIGRLTGDWVVNRLGAVRAVQLSGTIATLGGVLVVVSRITLPAIAGFALIGLGIAVVVPLAFAAAGRVGANPAQSIAGVATVGYGAGLAAPAVIGGVAQISSLSVSFALITLACVVMGLGARVLRP